VAHSILTRLRLRPTRRVILRARTDRAPAKGAISPVGRHHNAAFLENAATAAELPGLGHSKPIAAGDATSGRCPGGSLPDTPHGRRDGFFASAQKVDSFAPTFLIQAF